MPSKKKLKAQLRELQAVVEAHDEFRCRFQTQSDERMTNLGTEISQLRVRMADLERALADLQGSAPLLGEFLQTPSLPTAQPVPAQSGAPVCLYHEWGPWTASPRMGTEFRVCHVQHCAKLETRKAKDQSGVRQADDMGEITQDRAAEQAPETQEKVAQPVP